MKFFYLLVVLCFSLDLSSQDWNLVWEDNFEGNSLDNSKWTHDIGTGTQYGLYGWGNGELQYYQSQNTTLNNGIATITVSEEPNGLVDSWGNTSYYSSSKITTKGNFSFRYGKVEARIKTIDGEGFWPAFWMLPTGGDWPCDGEIDIMEQWGNNYLTNNTTGAAHIGNCPYSQSTHTYENFSTYISNGSYADEFHQYSVIWSEDTIKWFVDEIETFRITPSSFSSIPSQNTWPFNDGNWYIMINLAITQGGPNINTVFPNNIEIDYVRVYQNNITGNSNIYVDENYYCDNEKISANFLISSYEIYNIDGRLINLTKSYNKKNIELDNLRTGVYVCKFKNQTGNQFYQKIIIN